MNEKGTVEMKSNLWALSAYSVLVLSFVLFGAMLPLGCSSNNNPTSPNTPTITATIWADYTPTVPTNTPTSTATSTGTLPTSTLTPSPTPTGSFTPTNTPIPTSTFTLTSTWTLTPYPSPTATHIGSGPSTIQYPNGIAYANSVSQFYVAEGNGLSNGTVQILTSNLSVTLSLTSYGVTAFGNPNGVAVNSTGTAIYVLDSVKNAVYAFNASGAPVTSWVSYSGTTFVNPEGIAVDGNGYVYVADTGNNVVDKFDGSGNPAGQFTSGTGGSFLEPSAVVAYGTSPVSLFVADADHDQVQVFSNASPVAAWSTDIPGLPNSDIFGITTDGNYIYLADAANGLISKFTSSGVFQTATDYPYSPLQNPDGLVLANGNLYVTDFTAPSGHGSIQIFGP